VHESLRQQRRDGVKLFAAHGLDLLSDIRPIQVSVVHQFTGGPSAEQLSLVLGPQQNVSFVFAHTALPS
jgi:hypothetical protein